MLLNRYSRYSPETPYTINHILLLSKEIGSILVYPLPTIIYLITYYSTSREFGSLRIYISRVTPVKWSWTDPATRRLAATIELAHETCVSDA